MGKREGAVGVEAIGGTQKSRVLCRGSRIGTQDVKKKGEGHREKGESAFGGRPGGIFFGRGGAFGKKERRGIR